MLGLIFYLGFMKVDEKVKFSPVTLTKIWTIFGYIFPPFIPYLLFHSNYASTDNAGAAFSNSLMIDVLISAGFVGQFYLANYLGYNKLGVWFLTSTLCLPLQYFI